MKKMMLLFLLIITGCGVQAKEVILCEPTIEYVEVETTVIRYVDNIIVEYIEVPVEVVLIETVTETVIEYVEVIKEVEVIKYKTKWKTEYIEVEPSKIVFVGDSITRDLNKPLFENYITINNGIGGYTTENTYKIIKTTTQHNPEFVFIMLGINDIGKGLSIETTKSYFDLILSELQTSNPNVKIILQSVLPTSSTKGNLKIELILGINEYLKTLVLDNDNIDYLDLHQLFVNDNGLIKEEYTKDGVHLTEQGYNLWREILQDYDF